MLLLQLPIDDNFYIAGAKLPLSNASNKQNIARNAAKTNSDDSTKEPVKGKFAVCK